MTNPNDIIGTNAAYSGRTSPNAFNDVLMALHSRGIITGWECVPVSGMTVSIGGSLTVRDVAVAEDNGGNRLTVNTRDDAKGTPIEIALPEADENNPRVDAIVVYVNNPPEITEAIPVVDNPSICAMLVVSGEASSSPTEPDDATIRAAITADGGSGTTAYYVVIATIHVEAGATEIVADDITAGRNVSYRYIDAEIDSESSNPVANFAIAERLEGLKEEVEDDVAADFDSFKSEVKGTYETYNVLLSSWSEAADVEPFTYQASVTATYNIGDKTIVELINNDAVKFAKYGFSIASINNKTILLYAIEKPEAAVTLKISYREGA